MFPLEDYSLNPITSFLFLVFVGAGAAAIGIWNHVALGVASLTIGILIELSL